MTDLIVSIDLFDTLISRRVIYPKDVFLFQAEQAAKQSINAPHPKLWQKIRVTAENTARKNSRFEEINLDEIYKEIKSNLTLLEIEKLKGLEIDSEKKLCALLYSGVTRAKYLALNARRSCILTDMYLPKNVLREICHLNRIPNWDIFCSSATLKTKSTGSAFKHLHTDSNLKIPFKHIHLGDNLKSDYTTPKKLNLHPELFTNSYISKYEKSIRGLSQTEDTLAASLIAGAMKISRNRIYESNNNVRKSAWDIGCNITGPTSLLFIFWILRKCKAYNVRKIYFLSRDGQLPYRMSKILAPHLAPNIEIQYLYISRQSLHMPAITEIDDGVFEWLMEDDGKLTLARILNRLDLKVNDFPEGFPFTEEQVLNTCEIAHLRKIFLTDSSKKIILKKSQSSREILREYFNQEGMLDGKGFAIVDIGWHGRIQASISKLLEYFNAVPENGLYGFYLGLFATPKLPIWSKAESFLFNEETRNSLIKRNAEIYEILFSATHESTTKYCKDNDGQLIPVFKKENQNYQLIRDMQYGAITFAKNMIVAHHLAPQRELYSSCIGARNIIETLFCTPKKEEINVLSSITFSSSQESIRPDKVIGSTKITHIIGIFLGLKKPPRFFWLEAEIAHYVSPTYIRIFFFYIKSMRKTLRHLTKK